jgi:hypothetical protein
MGIQLAKARAGEPTQVDMTRNQLTDFASTKRKGLPERIKKPAAKARRK